MKHQYYALLGGLLVLLLAAGAWYAIGSIYYQSEAIELIESISRSALYFGAAVATGSATILALMLTLVGMAARAESEFGDEVYRSVYHVAIFATVTLCGAVILLLICCFPVGEFENVPTRWYRWLYHTMFAGVGILSALLVSTVLLLFLTIRQVISGIAPGAVS
ncbi:MAG: hypothetical protein LC634_01155 [Sphingomonadales bacterium]|nr:hypothetical protein [Sphingomonadales bacterium]